MDRPGNGHRRESSDSPGADRTSRARKRRRAFLNLGMPFAQVDDFIDQSEDAVALGYRVLADTVTELKAFFHHAEQFAESQKKCRENGEPPPPVPWEDLVNRLQRLQNISLDAVRDSTDIVLDSMRSSTRTARTVARTLERSRDDVESKPLLAGPIFEDPIEVKVQAGATAEVETREVKHRGLTRLRIHAVASPAPRKLVPQRKDPKDAIELPVEAVTFEPRTPRDNEDVSLLTVAVGAVRADQPPGVYEGVIRASNFELLLAKLRVIVSSPPGEADQAPPPSGARKKQPPPSGRRAR